MFAVVQDEQSVARAQVGGDASVRERSGRAVTSRVAATVAATEVRIGQGRQIDEDGALGELRRDVVRDDQGQPGLADPTGPGQGQQGHGFVEQERPSCGSLGVATDEPGARDRRGAETEEAIGDAPRFKSRMRWTVCPMPGRSR